MYELGPSLIQSWPMQILCDAQVKNDRRCIILSSIVRIFNNTTLPLILLNVDSVNTKHHTDVARIEVNQDYYVPIDLLYGSSKSSIFFSVDE